ncbi:hypothetical protein M3Y97_00701800 [Aphelenchoides bicaudatus]|nr:hypothetical protein M3Y97_00701800 [Aphelenchoides bicaudatus]
MIEVFVRLLSGEQDTSNTSIWQGILTFHSNVSINQLVNSALQSAGQSFRKVDPHSYNWRFLHYNHKFGEYCDTNVREKRSVGDGDKYQLIFAEKNGATDNGRKKRTNGSWTDYPNGRHSASVIAEVQNQTPLVFLDDDNNNEIYHNNVDEEIEDVKPSLDQLIRATTSSVLLATERAISGNDKHHDNEHNGREMRRGSRHLSSDLIRQLGKNYDDTDEELELEDEADENIRNFSPVTKVMRALQENGGSNRKRSRLNITENTDDEEFKLRRAPSGNNRRHSSIASETSSIEGGPCQQHAQMPDLCSHTKFKNVNALEILAHAPSGQAILDHLVELSKGTDQFEIEHGMRCKLMNTIGTYLMHNADTEGLPTAVERRILVHHFLAQLPCQLETAVFTNKNGTGCLDYWVRNRRKTNVREDGVYMVRGSKNRKRKSNEEN